MTPYECIHEIRKATGWSQHRISVETGLALSTVGRIFRMPGYRVNEISQRLLQQLHQQVVASPFPDYLEDIFRYYDFLKQQTSREIFSGHLRGIQNLLQQHREFDTDTLAAARIAWLMGHIQFDRGFYLNELPQRQAVEQAVIWYEKALKLLDKHQDKDLLIYQYKIRQCIVATYFNAIPSGQRMNSPLIRKWLKNINYIKLAKQVVSIDNWNWIAARNGLVAASILHDGVHCQWFWQAMQDANPNLRDPDFQPSNGVPAIIDDPDLDWFIHHELRLRQALFLHQACA